MKVEEWQKRTVNAKKKKMKDERSESVFLIFAKRKRGRFFVSLGEGTRKKDCEEEKKFRHGKSKGTKPPMHEKVATTAKGLIRGNKRPRGRREHLTEWRWIFC